MIYQVLSNKLFAELSDKFDKMVWNLTIHHEDLNTYELTITLMSNRIDFVSDVLNYLQDKYGLIESINIKNEIREYQQKFYNIPEEKIEQMYTVYKMGG